MPVEVCSLTQLRYLVLANNNLTSLPTEIGQLRQLRILNCAYNFLSTLPLTLSLLTQTDPEQFGLNFCGNSISILPRELSHLTISLNFQRVPQQLNACPRGTSFDSLKGAVSDSRQDLKKLQIPKLQEDAAAWVTTSLWLDKLMGSNDFKNMNTCSMTAERVLSILKLAEESKEYRAAFNAILTEALSTCIDRATLPLCSLEIQKAIIESKAGSIEQMLKVLKGAFASDLIDAHARQFVKNHHNSAVKREELEVYLGFQVKLKEEFNLPIGIQDVNYFFCSHIEATDLIRAKDEVHSKLQDREKFVECLCQQTAWTEKLVKEYSSERDVFLAPLNAEFGQLEDQMFAQALNSQQYEVQANALKTRFEAAEKAWLKIKTEELCLNIIGAPILPETVITVKCKDLPSDQNLFIRGSCAGLNWNQGVKLTPIDWETFQFKTNVAFTGELEYKFLINDDDLKWETGVNRKVSQGKAVECAHSFHVSLLPPVKKTVVQLEFSVSQGKTLFLCGTGPLGNWDRKVPMKLAGNNNDSWFFSFDGEFPTFEYKLLLDDQWEEGANRVARCGSKTEMKVPRF